ncbi:MAG: hypothetical protein WC357_02415 [Candidatus Omnitrophota bacterium]
MSAWLPFVLSGVSLRRRQDEESLSVAMVLFILPVVCGCVPLIIGAVEEGWALML